MPASNVTRGPELDDFLLFPKLPAELRGMIWNFACYQPRLVRVRCGFDDRTRGTSDRGPYICKADSQPAVMLACHESRREALRVYEPSFGLIPTRGTVFFNFHVDTLFFDCCPQPQGWDLEAPLSYFFVLAKAAEYSRVRRFAVDQRLLSPVPACGCVPEIRHQTDSVVAAIRRHLVLEHLTFVVRGNQPFTHAGIHPCLPACAGPWDPLAKMMEMTVAGIEHAADESGWLPPRCWIKSIEKLSLEMCVNLDALDR